MIIRKDTFAGRELLHCLMAGRPNKSQSEGQSLIFFLRAGGGSPFLQVTDYAHISTLGTDCAHLKNLMHLGKLKCVLEKQKTNFVSPTRPPHNPVELYQP